ncbi:DHH family phosphoesterase [Bdellovibrio sp. HCB337]|uniref:DHH family phosphoesterase n=1 Tax=Bdellovibrio sp. HCB337 TaxID=3394358 RepID=UPI0039A52C34
MTELIKKSQKIILSTHRQCDGDGLGAELALYYALKKIKKDVRIVNVDSTPRKYRFLGSDKVISLFQNNPVMDLTADLCLVFDTNDERLLEPLFSGLKKSVAQIVFIDHHPLLQNGPQPSAESYIDVTAASTGELAYDIIKALGIELDANIARALYTSITFDTQLYRYIRNSPKSHLIAAELLQYPIDPQEVHRALFGNQTVQKMAFLAKALGQIEYFCHGQLAVLRLRDADLLAHNLEPDEARDVIDMIMNIESLEAAVIFREDAENEYKLSLRSKGKLEVSSIAESLGGGGHTHAAGAFVKGIYVDLKDKIVKDLTKKISQIA